MKLNINLASRPYEDARHFYMQWLPLLLALGAIAFVLCNQAFLKFRELRESSQEIHETQRKIAELDREKATAEAILNLADNTSTRDQARFLNAVFSLKAFSWTRVLVDLERLMPTRAYVTSIEPELTPEHILQFKLKVRSRERADAIELLRRMELSSAFREPQIITESESKNDKEPGIMIEIVARYVPDGSRGEQ